LCEKGKLAIRYLNGPDLQPDHPIGSLLKEVPVVEQKAREIIVNISLTSHTIKKMNGLITNYYFELVLLYRDAAGKTGYGQKARTAMYTLLMRIIVKAAG
jgi:hypothetical protein